MFSLGSSKTSVSTSVIQNANQQNGVTISVGSGDADSTSKNDSIADLRSRAEITSKEDLGISAAVALAPSSQARSGEVGIGGDEVVKDTFFTSEKAKKYTPYAVVGGITLTFMLFLYSIFGKKKKGN